MVKLHVIKEGPWNDSQSNLPPILCLHGFPDNPSLFDKVAEHFLSQGRRIARVAWPNCGVEPNLKWGATFPELIDGLVEVVEPMGSVDIICHDFGAACGWLFEAKRPELVNSIVAVDISPRLPRDLKSIAVIVGYQGLFLLAFLIGDMFPRLANEIVRREATFFGRPNIPGYMESPHCFWYYQLWRRLIQKGPGSFGGSGRLAKCPCLYVYGTQKPTNFHTEEWLSEMERREDCRVIAMDTGHWGPLVEKVDDFLRHVDSFYSDTVQK